MHANVLSTVVQIHSSPSWHCELHQSTPSSDHLLSSCTYASLGPPFLPKSITLTQQPSKFMNRLIPALTPSDHKLINTANLLHTLYAGQPVAMYVPFTRFGSPLQCYGHYLRIATRYAPAMVLFTAIRDDTYMNAVLNLLTLFQTPQQLHCRLMPGPTSLCHSLHQPSLHSQCNLCLLHLQCLQLQSHRPQLSPPCQLSQRLPLHLHLQHPV